MTVVILEDAAKDIESGRQFYELREPGIGEYFVESILSDLSSLVLYAGSKEQLAALPRNEQDEVIAYLFHLRHAHDREYANQIGRRLKDKDPSHWLPPDAFERELDRKETP